MFNPLDGENLNPVYYNTLNPAYYVWRIGGNMPNAKHSSLGSARKEAKRLAELNKGCFFAVVKCVEAFAYQNNPFVVVKFSEEEIPF